VKECVLQGAHFPLLPYNKPRIQLCKLRTEAPYADIPGLSGMTSHGPSWTWKTRRRPGETLKKTILAISTEAFMSGFPRFVETS
ncbi:hypothetical protein LEMLEM_LOCUS16717, partial [Lemmus lemmus]